MTERQLNCCHLEKALRGGETSVNGEQKMKDLERDDLGQLLPGEQL